MLLSPGATSPTQAELVGPHCCILSLFSQHPTKKKKPLANRKLRVYSGVTEDQARKGVLGCTVLAVGRQLISPGFGFTFLLKHVHPLRFSWDFSWDLRGGIDKINA